MLTRPESSATVVPHHALQQQACFSPVTLHGALGNATHFCNFTEPKTAEEMQIHQFGERWIELG